MNADLGLHADHLLCAAVIACDEAEANLILYMQLAHQHGLSVDHIVSRTKMPREIVTEAIRQAS